MRMPGGMALAQLIVYLVRRLGSVPRTKLVKLVYLVDERWSQQHPTTLTGVSYVSDNHGPNAEGNVIVKAADVMQGHEVKMSKSLSKWAKPLYIYKVDHAPRFEPEFSAEAKDVIEESIRQYGGLAIPDIVALSKSTAPYRQSRPGDTLDMRSLSEKGQESLTALQQSVRALGNLEQFAETPVGDEEPEQGAVDRIQRRALLAETE